MGIERYRAIVKLEDIRTLFEDGDYEAAKVAADGIRKERLKDSADLFLLADVYRKNGDYATAKEFLLRIYEKKVTWRVLEELMEICLAEKKPEEANIYLKEYGKISGGDPRNYIYEYRIKRQMHYPDEQLLPLLQTLKAEEYTEKYAYELAKVYHKLGREEECMAECADLILWFGEGTYVERAKALQAYYRGELSIEDIRTEAKRRVREAEEQRAAAEAERKAYEEEKKRLAAEEELRRFEEEEGKAMEGEADLSEEAEATDTKKNEAEPMEAERNETEPDETEQIDGLSEEVFEEVAVADMGVQEEIAATDMGEQEEITATDMSEQENIAEESTDEPMWEADESVSVSVKSSEEIQMPEEYEQISLFAPAQETEEEVRMLSGLNPELSALLSARGIVFEEALHEFARIERVRKQLNRMLELIVTVRKKCHCLIITGEQGSGKTALATHLAKLLYELSYVKSPRVAKINAGKLNGMKLEEKAEQLRDCCLIVEEAGNLTEEAATALLDFIQNRDVLGTVILEDNANAMSQFLRVHAEGNRMFNNRIHLPKYDSDELMEFACGYIEEQDYEISRGAKDVLRQKIEHLTRVGQKEGRLVETMEIVKLAIKNADSRNQEAILAMASTGNFLAAGEMELTAEDFGIIR